MLLTVVLVREISWVETNPDLKNVRWYNVCSPTLRNFRSNLRILSILHVYTRATFVLRVECVCAFEWYDARNFPYDIDDFCYITYDHIYMLQYIYLTKHI